MELVGFVGKKIRIDTNLQGYYFVGICLDADENSLTLRDKNDKIVLINKNNILMIREELE